MIRRWSTHEWYTLELLLPRIDQVEGFTEILDLVAFSVRHSAGQRVCSRGRVSDTTPQVSQAVVDQSIQTGVLTGDSPGALCVRDHILLGLRGFAFELRGLVARFLRFSTEHFMSRTAVTDFPEGAAQFRTRCFMGGPAVREFFGSSSQIFAGALQVHLVGGSGPFGPCRALQPLLKPLHKAHLPLRAHTPLFSW